MHQGQIGGDMEGCIEDKLEETRKDAGDKLEETWKDALQTFEENTRRHCKEGDTRREGNT